MLVPIHSLLPRTLPHPLILFNHYYRCRNGPSIEEVPSIPSDAYAQALELIVHLGQLFSALLLLQQSDGGAYKQVAADHQIVIHGMGSNVSRDIRVEVLEIL